MCKILLSLLITITVCNIYAQHIPVFDHYIFSPVYVNPAATGSRPCPSVRITSRNQWTGIQGAPATQSLLASARLRTDERSTNFHAISLMLLNDHNADFRLFNTQGNYAFHFMLDDHTGTWLGMGLGFSYGQYTLDQTGFTDYGPDPAVNRGKQSAWKFDAATGLFLYNKRFFAGISALQLLPSWSPLSNDIEAKSLTRQYILQAGINIFTADKKTVFQPGIAFKTNEQWNKQLDLNLKVILSEKFLGGFSYHHTIDDIPGNALALVPFAGIILDSFSFTYAYELGLTQLQGYHYGTHQVMAAYRFCSQRGKIRKSRGITDCPAYR